MRQRLACAALALLCLFLSACGGGGSGGGSGFKVTPASLTFNGVQGKAAPAAQAVTMTFTTSEAAYVAAGFVGTPPAWMDTPTLTGSGRAWTLSVHVNTTGLPAGTYTCTLRAGIGKADQSVIDAQDIPVTYKVTSEVGTNTSSLAFDFIQGGTPPAAAQVAVTGEALPWTASADQSWIKLGAASGVTPATLSVSADPTGLPAGTYTGTVTLAHTGGTDKATLAVKLTVNAPALQAPAAALAFSGTNGTALAPQSLPVTLTSGAAVAWTASASDSWIVLDRTSGTTPGSLAVTADPSRGPLASGSYAGTITLSAVAGGTTLTRTVPVTLALARPALSVTPASLTLGGANGRDLSAQTLQVALGTGAAAFPWTLTASQPWIAPAAKAGSASATPAAVSVAPVAAGLTAGTYTGSITVSATVNGDVLTAAVPVDLNLEAHRLLAQDTGAAFASMPGLTALTRAIPVRDNLGLPTAWTAVSDQPWLAVTPSGTAGGTVTLVANPAGLAAGQIHLATVTLTAADPTVEGAERIQVGCWVGGTAPAALSQYLTAGVELATDPVRPYVYVATGGSDVEVWNVHTNAKVATLASLGAQIRHLAVAPDGSKLFVSDATNYRIARVALPAGTVEASWAVGATAGPHLACARANGHLVLLTGTGTVFDALTGAALGQAADRLSSSAPVSASLQGGLMSLDSSVYSLDYTALGGGKLLLGMGRWPNGTAWNTADYAFNADGSRFYAAFAAPYDFYVFDTTGTDILMPLVQTLPGAAYPGNVEVAKDGRIFCLSESASPYDFWIYNAAGVQLKAMKLVNTGSPIRSSGMKVSGDGLRVVTLTDGWGSSPSLQITTMAP